MILLNFGLFGVKYKKSHEFGKTSEPIFWQLDFIFFQLVKFQKGSSSRFIDYAWNMYNDAQNTKEWLDEVRDAKTNARIEVDERLTREFGSKIERLEKRYSSLQKQYSQIYYEKHALQQTIKIINNEDVQPDFYRSPKLD